MPYFIPPQALQNKNAKVKKETLTDAQKIKRINNLNNASVAATTAGSITSAAAPTVAAGVAASTVAGSGINRLAIGVAASRAGTVLRVGGLPGLVAGTGLTILGKVLEKKAVNEYNKTVNTVTADAKENVSFPPLNYEYNLPPHSWSLPIRPHTMDGLRPSHNFAQNNHPGDFHRLRRGVIWHWDNGNYISRVDDSSEKGFRTAAEVQADIASKNPLAVAAAKKSQTNPNNFKYGFQFLWNPETISSAISRNMDVTPSSADRFRSVAGAFPGQETYQFQIMLDRVNDFACIRSALGDSYQGTARRNVTNYNNPNTRHIYGDIPQEFLQYYKNGLGSLTTQKIADLAKFGTMADLEYLFKALNGDGASQDSGSWATLLRKKTANIGFLSPSLLAFRFGPNATQQLSFVGWITNLSINHTFFTEDMIPLRTTVSFSCDAFAGSTII